MRYIVIAALFVVAGCTDSKTENTGAAPQPVGKGSLQNMGPPGGGPVGPPPGSPPGGGPPPVPGKGR